MSAVIHIIQRDELEEVVQSTVIEVCDIAKITCTYPNKKDTNDSDDVASTGHPRPIEMEILLSNGDRENIEMTSPTVLRLLDGLEVFETSSLQKFEEAYMKILVEGVEDSE